MTHQIGSWPGLSRWIAVFLMLAMASGGSYAATRKLSVNMVMGEVYYKRGKAKPRPVRKTSRIKEKDVIRTLVESSVELRLDDGSSLRIEENSVVDLSKLVKDGKVTNTKVRIKTGKVLFNVKKLASKRSDFVFETPTATAAIRGTEGGIATTGKSTYAYLSEGGLELTPKGGGKAVTIRNLNLAIQEKTGFKVRAVSNTDVLKSVVHQIDKITLAADSLKPEDAEAALQALDSIPGLDFLIEVDSAVLPDTTLPADSNLQGDTASTDTGALLDTTSIDTVGAASVDTAGVADTLGTARPDSARLSEGDTSSLTDTLVSSGTGELNKKEAVPLTLSIVTPAAGQEYPQGADVTVTGLATPGAAVTVNGQPADNNNGQWSFALQQAPPGENNLSVSAQWEDQNASREVSFSVVEKEVELKLNITSPASGSQISGREIRAAGSGTPGAAIQIGNIVGAVNTSGQWELSIPAPSSPGEHSFTVESVFGDQALSAEFSVVIPERELALSLQTPSEGTEITAPQFQVAGKSTPGAAIQVFESRTTADASGNWNVNIQSPQQEGDYQLVVEASLGDQTRTEEIGIVRVIPREPLRGTLSNPPANLQVPNITLRGTCNDGATIEAGAFTAVARGGQWSLPVSWPEQEEGTIAFEVFCSLNDEEISLGEVSLEYTRPRIPLELNLSTPVNLRQSTAELVVQGNVKGQGVLVDVNGSAARVTSGQFRYTLRFSEFNWDMETIEVEASDGEEEILKIIQLEVDRSSPGINTQKPAFVGTPVIENNQAIRFGLKDSPGDEVTVAVLVDGSEEENFTFEGALSGQIFTLIPGVHDYRIEALDLAGNKAVWERRQVEYFPRAEWRIDLVRPVADRTVLRPPRTQVDSDWEPTEDIRIRIQSLPDDDFRYLKEVRIFNEANSAERIWRDIEIDDIEFEFEDMPLVMNKTNRILIRVEPKNGPIRSKVLTYTLTDGS